MKLRFIFTIIITSFLISACNQQSEETSSTETPAVEEVVITTPEAVEIETVTEEVTAPSTSMQDTSTETVEAVQESVDSTSTAITEGTTEAAQSTQDAAVSSIDAVKESATNAGDVIEGNVESIQQNLENNP